jgi:hypothetical protein
MKVSAGVLMKTFAPSAGGGPAKVIDESAVQFRKALLPMLVTAAGIWILCRLLHE